MSSATLIEEWLDDTLDDPGQVELERQLADPTVANQLVRAAHFRHTLRRLAAESPTQVASKATRAPLRMLPRPRARRRPTAWWLATAACLCAAIGTWLVVAQQSAAPDRPSLAGQTLVAGHIVSAGDAPLVLQWRDGTRADLAAGGELRVEAGQGKRLALLRGSLLATVAKQPVEAPMRIRGSDCEAVVLGTVLEFTQGAAATRLTVSSGAVRLVRDRDGFDTTIADGGTCLLPFHGQPGIDPKGLTTTMLDDDGILAERSARCGDSDACQLASEPGVSGPTAARITGTLGAPPVREVGGVAHSWILLTSTPTQGLWNLESSDGIEFWYRGPGTGGRVWIELICHQQLGNARTHFVSYAPDTVPGWRRIRLPWSSFALREGQPPGTPLRAAGIGMINIAQLGEQHPDYAVDRIAGWTEQKAAPP